MTARGTVYARLEGLLNSGGAELLSNPPHPYIFNIEGMVTFFVEVGAVEQVMLDRGFSDGNIPFGEQNNNNNSIKVMGVRGRWLLSNIALNIKRAGVA